ncbi:MAG: GspH/FimT family pseudopilin [Acinetobacter tjernbergiae]
MGNSRGFTLVELIVTTTIIAILIVIAMPSFGDMLTRQKLDASTREFMATLSQARSQAAVLRTTVAICPSRLSTDPDFTKEECAQAAIPEYTATTGSPAVSVLNDDQKKGILDSRVFMIDLDSKVSIESTSASFVLFNNTGGVAAVTNFRLCASGNKRLITVARLGGLTLTKSTGACV